MDFVVYSLIDPRTNEIRYIGVTNDLNRRIYQHKYWAKNKKRTSHVYNWISRLMSIGLDFKVKLLQSNLTQKEAFEREIYWISEFNNLTNLDGGGKGFGVKNKIWKGRSHSSTTKLKMSKSGLGHKVSISTRIAISNSKNAKPGDNLYKSKNNRGAKPKSVNVYDAISGKLLYEFSSMLECSRVLNLNRSFIKRRFEENKPYKQFKFKIHG